MTFRTELPYHTGADHTLVDLPDDRQAIENKWIYKARLVAKGFRQVQGVDYDESL